MTYHSTIQGTKDGFGQLLRAEWTKFWSVRGTVLCLLVAIGLSVLLSMFLASSFASTDANEGSHYVDQFSFVHQPLAGDGSVVARVQSQRNSHQWAKAGVIIKQSTQSGTPYAAVMVTPGHGVRFETTFDTQFTGNTAAGGPRWLKLTRSGRSALDASPAHRLPVLVDTTVTEQGGTTREAMVPAILVGTPARR